MLFDSLDHLIEKNLDTRLSGGLAFLKNIAPDIEIGRHGLEGQAYAMVDEYETVPEDSHEFEAHKQYIDIQILLRGEETIQWRNIDQMEQHKPYDEKDDYWLFTPKPNDSGVQNLVMSAGLAAVFYPSDGHKPGVIHHAAQSVKKVVVKVPV